MTTIKLRYVRRKGGNLFWEPTPPMRELGFAPKPLGPDGPDAHAEAARLYGDWLKARAKAARVTEYPPGSFGAYYDRFRRTIAWKRKSVRTKEDYARAWKHLEPRFARRLMTGISVALCEEFQEEIEAKLSPSERYRVMKVFRALMADAIARLQLDMKSPVHSLPNPQPRGRSAIWLGSEIEQLAWGAAVSGHPGMALAIRIAWDTLFSPVDVWSLRFDAVKRDRGGRYVERARTKTDKGAFGALSETTSALLDAYLERLGLTMRPDTPIIRQRNGHAYPSKDTFGDHFREVRLAVFGPGEKRQFMDIRRSGSVEADAAGADKTAIGEILANGVGTSAFLDDTYTPPTVARARLVAEQRMTGRARLEAEIDRVQRSKSA